MPGSSTSLDSLSSPSPSPSPQPDTATKAHEPPNSAGLDGDSELSELTDDEQDNSKPTSPSNRRGGNNSAGRRGASSRRGRSKGSSLVPPAMWGWAATKADDDAEEEEEDDRRGAASRPMEEEEGDDDCADDTGRKQPLQTIAAGDELDHSHSLPSSSADPSVVPPAMGPSTVDMQPAMDLVDLALAMAQQQDASVRASDPSPRRPDGAEDMDIGTDEDAFEDDPVEPMLNGNDNNNETESEDDRPKEEEEEEEDDDDDAKAPIEEDAEEEVDITAPSLESVAPIVAAASASSIMAGSAVVETASPSSTTSSRSQTPASSRSASPEPEPKSPLVIPKSLLAPAPPPDATVDNDDEEEEEEEEEIDELAQEEEEEVAPPPKRKGKARGKQKPDMRIDVEMDNDQDMDIDGDLEQEDDMGTEMESDVQPAHRAEALDVLAHIEFKFGRLRETLYVERMEQLAWEESLILDGIHPELLHYQKELSARRDKRIQLATRKRDLEIATIYKKRRVNETFVWSWWKHERDELQTDMIAENNRKRRRLEREKRALDRPQPMRRIPLPPTEVPPAPSLKQVVDSLALSDHPTKRRKLVDGETLPVYPELLVLTSAQVQADLDFLYSLRRPKSAFGHRMPPHPPINGSVSNQSMYEPFSGESFPPMERMQPPPSSFSHHGPPLPQPSMAASGPTPMAFPPFGANPSRSHHDHHPGPGSNPPSLLNQPGSGIHGPSPFAPMDSDVSGPHVHYGSASQPPPGFHGPGSSRRSSMSPAPNGFVGKGNGQWMGPGMGMPMFNLGGAPSKGPPGEWVTDARHEEDIRRERERESHRDRETYDRREMEREHARELEREHREREHREREREHRERERDRDREREREREGYLMQQQQMMHGQPPSHPHGGHHHHHRGHHHHVLHRHHGPPGPPSAGPSLSPRATREYERPHSRPNAEMINLSAPKSAVWKGDDPSQRRAPPMPMPDERDRPAAVPFAMGSAPPNRIHSPRASWGNGEDYRPPGHRYPAPPTSSSSRTPLPSSLAVSPQARTLPPPTSPNSSRYRDDMAASKKMMGSMDSRNGVDAGKNGSMRMVNEMREKDRTLPSPPPRMGIPPRVPQLVDGS